MTTEKALVLEYSRVSRSRFVAIMIFWGGVFCFWFWFLVFFVVVVLVLDEHCFVFTLGLWAF